MSDVPGPNFWQELTQEMQQAPIQEPVFYVGRQGYADLQNALGGVVTGINYGPTITEGPIHGNIQYDENGQVVWRTAPAATARFTINTAALPQGTNAQAWLDTYRQQGVAIVDAAGNPADVNFTQYWEPTGLTEVEMDILKIQVASRDIDFKHSVTLQGRRYGRTHDWNQYLRRHPLTQDQAFNNNGNTNESTDLFPELYSPGAGQTRERVTGTQEVAHQPSDSEQRNSL